MKLKYISILLFFILAAMIACSAHNDDKKEYKSVVVTRGPLSEIEDANKKTKTTVKYKMIARDVQNVKKSKKKSCQQNVIHIRRLKPIKNQKRKRKSIKNHCMKNDLQFTLEQLILQLILSILLLNATRVWLQDYGFSSFFL